MFKYCTVATIGVGLIYGEQNGEKQYYLTNVHGDVDMLADGAGNVIKTYTYDAFGVEINKDEADANPFRYAGEYYDGETDSIYLRARYYAPRTGRFTTEDPIRDGLNWYSYCGGNPVMRIDPSGMRDEPSQLTLSKNIMQLMQRIIDYQLYPEMYDGEDIQSKKDQKDLKVEIMNSEYLKDKPELEALFRDVLYPNKEDVVGGSQLYETSALLNVLAYYNNADEINKQGKIYIDVHYDKLKEIHTNYATNSKKNQTIFYDPWVYNYEKQIIHLVETYIGYPINRIQKNPGNGQYTYNCKYVRTSRDKLNQQEDQKDPYYH